MIHSWRTIVLCVLAMVAAIAVALVLIEPLSLRAAIRGGLITIGVFLGSQIALRLTRSRQAR